MFNSWKQYSAAAAAAVLLAASAGNAAAQGVFTIDPNSLPDGTSPELATETSFNADFISGISSELVTLGAPGPGQTFTADGWINFTGFSLAGTPISAFITGMDPAGDYQLYATFQLAGTLTSGAGGATAGSTWTLTLADFQVFADINTDTDFTQADASSATAATVSDTGDDIFLAFGSLLTGTAGFNALGGAFINVIDMFAVCTGAGTADLGGTAVANPLCTSGAGQAFFSAPIPFYNIVFGEFNNTTQGLEVSGNLISINQASGGVDFATVAEPSSLLLLGLGLVAFGGFARRRMV